MASALAAGTPTPRGYRIAVLSSAIEQRHLTVLGALNALGYEVGRNLSVDYRFAPNKPEALPELARELVATQPDLIIAPLNPELVALAEATRSIPIVMAFSSMPVELGLVKSLARPGGNITGTTTVVPDTAGKMLQVLRDALPQANRFRILIELGYPGMPLYVQAFERAAKSMGLRVGFVDIRTTVELDAALAALERDKPDAAILSMTGVLITQSTRLIDFCARQRLPALYSINGPVRRGGLMSYSADFAELARRQAAIVDRILKGAKPGDIPVEEPSKFRLVFNAKTAKALGLTLAPSFSMRVDEFAE